MAKNKTKKDTTGLPIFFITVVLSLIVHYFVFSGLNIHPTIHVIIGLLLFLIFSNLISAIFKKFL